MVDADTNIYNFGDGILYFNDKLKNYNDSKIKSYIDEYNKGSGDQYTISLDSSADNKYVIKYDYDYASWPNMTLAMPPKA